MDAANPLCRWLLLAVGLVAVIGCQSDAAGMKARGQLPQEPIAPPAPPPDPGAPISPIAPIAPLPPTGGPPVGSVSPISSAPVAGSPVPPGAKGVVPASFVGPKKMINAAELLKRADPQVRVVAIVGDNNVVTDREVIEAVWQQYDELAKLEGHARDTRKKELYTAALRKTIERELILDDMYAKLKKANKMAIVEEIKEYANNAVTRQIGEFRKKAGAKSDDEFDALLRLQGLTLPIIRRQLERQVMADQYVSGALKDKGRRVGLREVRNYYDRHPTEFQLPDRVKWLHVFVGIAGRPNAQAALNHAEAIRQKAAAGADFAALSKQFDEGVAGKQNGFGVGETRKEILPADIEPTVWALQPGQMSGVVQTPTGYHLIKVIERDYAGVRPFDAKIQGEIRDKLTKELHAAEYKKLVEELWRKGVVRVVEE